MEDCSVTTLKDQQIQMMEHFRSKPKMIYMGSFSRYPQQPLMF